ncbi:hypothetical protein [Marinicella gelatinilytica]|uniref:hypothetical protein n=1 Tax=Marinicella gelatinilytica TaxID=2996017 RepID=UPI002260C122|nr:hypothetical protein [Marinicella gelatinilytica]MCX7544835.1 hypothetical protein [Marinicella gelatinilytica]
MANQSKSMVFGFVIIAAIIFAVALGYKMTQSDEPVNTPEPVVQEEKEPEIKVVSYDKKRLDMTENMHTEEHEKIRKRSPYFMQFAMKFKTGEEAVNRLPELIDKNKFDEAKYLVQFIETQFPDTKIPDEFADL